MSPTTTTTTTTTTQESGGGPVGLTSVGLASLIVKTREVGADAAIASVPLSESRGLPLHQNTNSNPPQWPTVRGTPRYAPRDNDYTFADRPLGQNGGEATFLVFMFSGVYGIHVSRAVCGKTRGRGRLCGSVRNSTLTPIAAQQGVA